MNTIKHTYIKFAYLLGIALFSASLLLFGATAFAEEHEDVNVISQEEMERAYLEMVRKSAGSYEENVDILMDEIGQSTGGVFAPDTAEGIQLRQIFEQTLAQSQDGTFNLPSPSEVDTSLSQVEYKVYTEEERIEMLAQVQNDVSNVGGSSDRVGGMEKRFGYIVALIAVLILVLIALIIVRVMKKKNGEQDPQQDSSKDPLLSQDPPQDPPKDPPVDSNL